MRHPPPTIGRLFAAVVISLIVPTASASELSLVDLVRLVEAGMPDAVVEALVDAEGLPALSAEDWIRLREAGATDRLLEALAGRPADADAETRREETPGAYRAFFREDEAGSEVFVLTNLDDAGNRLGGTASHPVRPNLVVGREFDPALERKLARKEIEEREAPTPEPAPLTIAAASRAPALLPEHIPGPTAFVRTGRYGGFFYPYPFAHLYPPGSYTHLKLYHQGGRPGLSHYQLPMGQVFYQPLFPTAGSHRRR